MTNFCKNTLKIVQIAILLLAPQGVLAGVYSFGGSCASQGVWTQAAFAQTGLIRSVVETIKNDKNCSGLESILGQLAAAENLLKAPDGAANLATTRLQSLPNEIEKICGLRDFIRRNLVYWMTENLDK